MRKFFKPIEIDDELEEHFDLSTERGYSSTENILRNTSTNTARNDNSENHRVLNDDQTNFESVFNASKPETHDDFDERMRLQVKLGLLYSRYCDAKKRQSKWNELNEKVSKSSEVSEHTPSIIKDMLAQSKKESSEHKCMFGTNVKNSIKRSFNEKMNIMMLMAFLRLPEEQSSFMGRKNMKCQTANQFEDSQLSYFNVPVEHESKYASQLKKLPEQSHATEQLFASSTPHKLLAKHPMSAVPIHHSPIIGAAHANQMESHDDRKKRIRDKHDPNWYLKYLGLNSISDLFSDNEGDDSQVDSCDNKTKSDDQENESQLWTNLNKSICGNDSLIEEPSQYTVSRILKICDDAERERGDRPTVPIHRRRLYVGSVDDLFCDDDGEDGDDKDDCGIINSQCIGVSTRLSSSDDTVDYDADDAMAQHKQDPHHSTILFKDSIVGEASQRLSTTMAKPVVDTKSDELFSTYNETVANSSKASVNCTKRSAIHSRIPDHDGNLDDDDDIIPTTPIKCTSSNFFAYCSRSPSMLIKSSSILSANNHNSSYHTSKKSNSDKSNNSDVGNKSPTSSLSFKLSALNSQITLSKHFDDDFDGIKENVDIDTNTSPFATCQTSSTTYRNQSQLNSPEPSIDTFNTCQSIPV